VRHTAATHLVRKNVDLHTVRKILGHTQLATTERYLSMTHDDLRAKHAAGSPFADMLARLRQERPQPERKRHRLSPREAS
jgi:integrase